MNRFEELNYDHYESDFSADFDGFSFAYEQVTMLLKNHAADMARTICIWLWVPTWPAFLFTYRIVDGYSWADALMLALLFWTLQEWVPLFSISRWALRWRKLEKRGVRWTRLNGANYRVSFYRKEDNLLHFDTKTHAERSASELVLAERRKQRFFDLLTSSIYPLAVLIGIVIGFSLLEYYGFPRWVTEIRLYTVKPGTLYPYTDAPLIPMPWPYQSFFEKIHIGLWRVELIAAGWWFLERILPHLVRCGLAQFEEAVYRSGAQFIPGAFVYDPPPHVPTLETMMAEKIHGDMQIVHPVRAAMLMGR